MQPVVLAWALLFVIAFGIVYRFFSWLSRRVDRESPAQNASHEAKETLVKTVAAPVRLTPPTSPSAIPPQAPAPLIISGEPAVEIRKPAVSASPPPRPVTAEPTVAPPPASPIAQPASVSASVSAPGAAPANTPRPAPASQYAALQPSAKASPPSVDQTIPAAVPTPQITAASANPGASSAVMLARSAAAAAATIAMSAAPSPRTAAAPSVAATLAPRPFAVPAAPTSSIPAAPSAGAEAPTPVPRVAAVLAPIVAVVPLSPPAAATNGSARVSSPPAMAHETMAQGPGTLRARRIGAEFPSLDVRLKDSRSRKTLPALKASRKPPKLAGTREMKVLVQRTTPQKAARRVGRKLEEANVLASAKAQTRIVGLPQRAPRVLAR